VRSGNGSKRLAVALLASKRVSLTLRELIRLRDLQGAAWGRDTKAYKKLNDAIRDLDEKEAD
jgi:hypothetical protein